MVLCGDGDCGGSFFLHPFRAGAADDGSDGDGLLFGVGELYIPIRQNQRDAISAYRAAHALRGDFRSSQIYDGTLRIWMENWN